MASIALEHVSKRYGDEPSLTDLSLEIADGEFLSLVGPSGCGKSTTLGLIAGLEAATAGTVRIGGADVGSVPPQARDVAMVFQSYALYPHLDVHHNLAFPLRCARLPRAEIEHRVGEVAARLGLSALLGRRPVELSGGQRQRVALGRALVRRPRVFLFDEPLSNLDAGLRTELRLELKRLHQELRATFIYVTHDQAEAMTLSDRIALLDRGRLVQVGTPDDLYEQPNSVFAARFFGSPPINVVASTALRLGEDSGLLVGVRPEHVVVGQTGAIPGKIDVVEPLGFEKWVTVDIGQARITARTSAAFDGRVGDAVGITVDTGRVHGFDARTGARVVGFRPA